MRRYLSFGAGVNSTALLLWLLDHGIDFEAVYADHGADWPETRDYVAMLQERGYPITVLETRREGLALYDYYLKYRFIPVRIMRACTEHYKVRPLMAYQQQPCIVYMGFSADEAHRAKGLNGQEYPLIDNGIDRAGCIEIIKAHGLPVPMKSGCFLCPFQRRRQWVSLRTLHPDLYCKAKRLEDATNERLQELTIEALLPWIAKYAVFAAKYTYLVRMGKLEPMERVALKNRWRAQNPPPPKRAPIYLADRPLDAVCQDGQADMFYPDRAEPCLCEL